MGRNRRDGRAASAASRPADSGEPERGDELEAILAELWAVGHAARPVEREVLEALVEPQAGDLTPNGAAAVERRLEQWLVTELARNRERNWEVGDLHHTVARRLDAAADRLLLRLLHRESRRRYDATPTSAAARELADATALLEEHGPVPDGDGPVLADPGATRASVWITAVELLRLLTRTPTLPPLGPTVGDLSDHAGRLDGAGGEERKLLDRVRGLLAKAESTTFPDEADALTAKAQELMARHAIDQAMVGTGRSAGGAARAGAPTSRRLWLDQPYLDGKSLLLTNVATANRCRAVFFKSLGFMTVVGFPADLDAVELLFTSLLVQADAAIRDAGSHTDGSGRSRTRSFRASFWVAFASRIGARLEEAVAASVHDAEADLGGAVLPVLASREEQVEAHLDELFPDAAPRGVVASNRAGWHAGTAAADRADIGVRRPIRSSS